MSTVKPFDVDLSWMGKFRNHEKASFWSADTDEGKCKFPTPYHASYLKTNLRTLRPHKIRPRRRQHNPPLRQNPQQPLLHLPPPSAHPHHHHLMHFLPYNPNLVPHHLPSRPFPPFHPLHILRDRRRLRLRNFTIPREDVRQVSGGELRWVAGADG